MKLAPLFLVAVAAAFAAGGATASSAFAKDAVKEAQELKAKREAFRKKLKDEKKFPFFDLTYYADQTSVKESRWTQTDPPGSEANAEKGLQLVCQFSPDITKGTAIEILCQKFLHNSLDGKSTYTMNWEKAGIQCSTSETKKMIEGMYWDTKRGWKDVVEAKCVEPKKRRLGQAIEMYASVWGTDPESQKRARKDIYMWKDANTTWLLWVNFGEKWLDDPKIMEKAEEFIGTIREIKNAPK